MHIYSLSFYMYINSTDEEKSCWKRSKTLNLADEIKIINKVKWSMKGKKITNWQIKEGLNCSVTRVVDTLKGPKSGQRLDNGCKQDLRILMAPYRVRRIRIGSVLPTIAQRVANPTLSLYIIGYRDRVKVQYRLVAVI